MRISTPKNRPIGKHHPRMLIIVCAAVLPFRELRGIMVEMRVIAGTYRSRLLCAPRGMGTRPTSDRLRETLFNILAPRIAGCRFADLYAGTGAVGIEAISRGAHHVWFAEKAEPALAALRTNLAALKITRGYTLEERGAGAPCCNASEDFRQAGQTSSISIRHGRPRRNTLARFIFLAALEDGRSLRQMPWWSRNIAAKPHCERFGALRRRPLKQGDAALSFYAVAQRSKARNPPLMLPVSRSSENATSRSVIMSQPSP